MNKQQVLLLIMTSLFILSSCTNGKKREEGEKEQPIKVELKQENGKYQVYCDGKPFYIKGAGLEFGNMESLAKHGGNAFRTWRVDNGQQTGREVLDEARKYGLLVCMGIEVGRERHGFDYNDQEAVQQQFDQIKKDVMELKDHPALMMWGIGNELNLHYENDKVWDAVNDIAAMIHEVDPNHPTTTMLAGAGKKEISLIAEKCPDLDFISFQLYGDIVNLPKYIKESNYKGPYIVSEWGATGHWEVARTEWERPIEQNSHEKAEAYHERYLKVIASDPDHCIGSFVFLWGQKQERTPTWYGVFLENGDKTEAVDVMQYVWTGKWPENRAPKMISMTLDDKTAYDNVYLKAGNKYMASTTVEEPDGDPLQYKWTIMKEVPRDQQSDGGDFEQKPNTILVIEGGEVDSEVTFEAPASGEYRLFVYASDGKGSSATANIPFMVK
ncbi:MAG: glycoside hydrolase family 2 TIM barrel-domain containing protein [bacterium]